MSLRKFPVWLKYLVACIFKASLRQRQVVYLKTETRIKCDYSIKLSDKTCLMHKIYENIILQSNVIPQA